MKCEICGAELKPAPAKFDGEFTYVGYLPCNCTRVFNVKNYIRKRGQKFSIADRDTLKEMARNNPKQDI